MNPTTTSPYLSSTPSWCSSAISALTSNRYRSESGKSREKALRVGLARSDVRSKPSLPLQTLSRSFYLVSSKELARPRCRKGYGCVSVSPCLYEENKIPPSFDRGTSTANKYRVPGYVLTKSSQYPQVLLAGVAPSPHADHVLASR